MSRKVKIAECPTCLKVSIMASVDHLSKDTLKDFSEEMKRGYILYGM